MSRLSEALPYPNSTPCSPLLEDPERSRRAGEGPGLRVSPLPDDERGGRHCLPEPVAAHLWHIHDLARLLSEASAPELVSGAHLAGDRLLEAVVEICATLTRLIAEETAALSQAAGRKEA